MLRSPVASRFKTSTAAGALAVAMFAMPQAAHAAGECGELTPRNGELTCVANQEYLTGIEYISNWGDVTLHLEDGLSVDSGDGYAGIGVIALNGGVTIDGHNANVNAQGFHGIVAFATGDINVDINDVSTSGLYNNGIQTWTENGDTVINANNVTTNGHVGFGINAGSVTGDIAIGANSVTTNGLYANGIQTATDSGNTVINAGNIATNGDYSLGILAQSGSGDITISADNLLTMGFASDGITALSYFGDVDVTAGSITGSGDYLWGVNVQNGNHDGTQWVWADSKVAVDNIAIFGQEALGVNVVSTGSADVKIGNLLVSGDHGNGAVVMTLLGDAKLEVDTATFDGVGTGGIVAWSEEGNASVKVRDLYAANGGGAVAFSGLGEAHIEAGKVDIGGEYATGVQAVTVWGDKASIKVDEVVTRGTYSAGVVGTAMHGDLTIEAGKISTFGYVSHGIQGLAKTVAINATGPISTEGYQAYGILAHAFNGDNVIHTAGPITTAGEWGIGLYVAASTGLMDVKSDGKITTSGENAWGIWATGFDGAVKLDVADIETSGVTAHGIMARTAFVEACLGDACAPDYTNSFTSNIDITAGRVVASGAGANGIIALGMGNANIDVGMVKSASSYGIETNMIGNSTVKVRGSVTSTASSAIKIEGEDTFVNVLDGATVAGGEHGIIVKAVGERCNERPDPSTGETPCPNPGSMNPYPDPEPLPVVAGFATINNAGTITAGNGYAVKVENGTLTLNNSGTILGAVSLGVGDDVINNDGYFIVTKDSEFGAGNDTFKNTATLSFGNSNTLAAGPAAEFKMVGLEKFENAGLVELRNGVAGDKLILPGNYVGNNGQLGFDVNFATGEADKLVVEGVATGTTELLLNVKGGSASLSGDTHISLVEVGFGSPTDAFKLSESTANIGFIHYGLTYDDVTSSYVLNAEAGSGAYRQLNALEGLSNNWYASADAVRTNITAARDGLATGNRLWGQVQTGKTKRDVETRGQVPVAYDYEQDRTGFQIGFDFAGSESDNGSFRFGVTAGYGSSDLDSKVVKEKVSYDVLNFGAYASLTRGKWFGSLLAKYDQQDVEFNSTAAGFEAKADGASWGVELEGGAHFATGEKLFVEPIASIALTRNSLDAINVLNQTLDFDDADGVRGKLGIRFGGNNSGLRYYGSAKAVHDFGGRNSLTLTSGGEQAEIKSDRLGTFVEGVLGASYSFNRLEAFVEGQGERGSDYDGIEGRLGVRFKL